MNEQRIRKIANQASDHAERTVEYFTDTKDCLDYPAKMLKVRDLKFAELIVQECVTICNDNIVPTEQQGDLTYNDGVMDCSIMIERHFRVEE